MLDPTDEMLEFVGEDSPQKKTCADCGTSKTPLWRGGPAGPKSLCNACGIRSRKKRRDLMGLNTASSSVKERLVDVGKEALMQRSKMEKRRRKFGEEEQAAVLLMALSCGSVYG
ncbi:GATA transcription factor 16 [Linum perenne]